MYGSTNGGLRTELGTLDEYQYAHDADGNVTSRINALDSVMSEFYRYNDLNELTDFQRGASQAPVGQGADEQQWSLDALGNNLLAGAYSAANEETPNQGSSGYDLAGNMTTLESGDTAVYDAWSRLVEVDNGSGPIEKYEYDGTNRRIEISSDYIGSTPGTVTTDYYAGQQVVESDITSGGQRAGGYQCVWSSRYIDAPVLRDTLNTSGTAIVSAGRVYYLDDANYNVTSLVTVNLSTGSWGVGERYTYTAYGAVTVRRSDWSPISGNASQFSNTILYTGHEYNFATQLYYCRARYYDAALERFVGRDPISYNGGINLYEYVGDEPTIHFDPSGLDKADSPFYCQSDKQCHTVTKFAPYAPPLHGGYWPPDFQPIIPGLGIRVIRQTYCWTLATQLQITVKITTGPTTGAIPRPKAGPPIGVITLPVVFEPIDDIAGLAAGDYNGKTCRRTYDEICKCENGEITETRIPKPITVDGTIQRGECVTPAPPAVAK